MEETLFLKYMGNNPTMRVMEYLLETRNLDCSLSDIARNSSVGWTTLYRLWPRFVENKIVIPTRNIGNAKLFQLNKENEIVQHIIKLFDTILISNFPHQKKKTSSIS